MPTDWKMRRRDYYFGLYSFWIVKWALSWIITLARIASTYDHLPFLTQNGPKSVHLD